MKGTRDSRVKKLHYIFAIAILLVMLATYYLPDLAYAVFDDTEEAIIGYSYVTRFALIYLCLLVMAVYYLVLLICRIVKKNFPKDYFKPSKWVLRGAMFVGFALATWLFVTDTSATLSDLNTPAVYEAIDVISVNPTSTGARFKRLEDKDKDVAMLSVCYKTSNVGEMGTGRKYRFRLLPKTGVIIAVEDLGPTVPVTE